MKPEELLNVIKRNGISLTEIEADWLISFLDPNGLNQLFVEDLLALLEISGNSDYDEIGKKRRLQVPKHLLQSEVDIVLETAHSVDESTNGTKYKRYSEKQLNEIAKLELEMQDLMNDISRAEDDSAWWEHQKEWEEATVRSVVARRARLKKLKKKLISDSRKLVKLKEIKKKGSYCSDKGNDAGTSHEGCRSTRGKG